MLWHLIFALIVSIKKSGAEKMNLVLSADDDEGPRALPLLGPLRPLDTQSLHITSAIKSRYSMVHITREVRNPEDKAQEAIFLVTLPETAFISNFSMVIKGREYVGKVKEKKEARRIYEDSVGKGLTAGHIEAQDINVRFSNKFDVAVNIEPREIVTFLLTYEELLERRKNMYEHVININAGQIIEDLRVDIFIKENKKMTFIKVPQIREKTEIKKNEKDNEVAVIEHREDDVYISYAPNKEQQTQVSDKGVNGQLVIQYDLMRDDRQGELQVEKQYFVHFFAPELQLQLKKHVVFVIDTSGSMSGTKLAQTKNALIYIFDQLKEGDLFSIVEFDDKFKVYNGEDGQLATTMDDSNLVSVTSENVQQAKVYIQSLVADGGTNINKALLLGLDAAEITAENEDLLTLLVFLTDGQPTNGETLHSKILENVKRANHDLKIPIFCLAFGQNADFPFLKKLSFQNHATARKIYEAEDANTQLKEFFDEISKPLLSDIDINFQPNSVVKGSVPRTKFGAFFEGSEFVIAGKLTHPEVDDFDLKITAKSAEGSLVMVAKPVEVDSLSFQGKYVNFLERLWAYLNIKELFIRALETDNEDEAETMRKQALKLSLEYNFVTQVTSMVVVQPDSNSLSGLKSGDKGWQIEEDFSHKTANRDIYSIMDSGGSTLDGSCFNRVSITIVMLIYSGEVIFNQMMQ